jgi:hypothetical protein
MTTYTLRNISATVWDITTGRKKVGFVRKVPAGYAARIGDILEIVPDSPENAFHQVVAKKLGFKSPQHLAQHNAEVRTQNRQISAEARYAADQCLNHSNFEPLFNLLGRIK